MKITVKIVILLLAISVLAVQGVQKEGDMPGLVTGIVTLSTNDLARTNNSNTYTVRLSDDLSGLTLGYALALAGFDVATAQSQYVVIVNEVTFNSGNTLMSLNVSFNNPSQSNLSTLWLKLKWTYLVVSANFDGQYTNIWATNAQFNPSLTNVQNVPIDTGKAFLAMGGDVGDCDIYVTPLLQVDVKNCKAVPANGQYLGGKTIIHAYITGFLLNNNPNTSETVSVTKGNSSAPFSDSIGWQIVYSSILPNGPKITVPSQNSQLIWIQVSFLFVRMDYYATGYPLNSQLQYSSSHIFTAARQSNTQIKLTSGDINQYNQNYFQLPDASYLIYGLSAFTFTNSSGNSLYSVNVNVDASSYSVLTPGNAVSGVVISGDLFIKNVMKLCSEKSNEKSLVGKLTRQILMPNDRSVTALDVTNSVPLLSLTTSQSPIVYKLATTPSASRDRATFTNYFTFPDAGKGNTLKVEIRHYYNSSETTLVENQQYSIEVKANGQVIYSNAFIYRNGSSMLLFQNIFRGLYSNADALTIQTTVSFNRQSVKQEFYILIAAYSYPSVYDPLTKSCLTACPARAGIDALIIPSCVYCNAEAGLIYDVAANSCGCQAGSYLDQSSSRCLLCGTFCQKCNETACLSCLGEAKLLNATCKCNDGFYLSKNECVICPRSCKTCTGPTGLCLTCNNNFRTNNCQCASGYFNQVTKDCGICNRRCQTCSATNPCLSCADGDNRVIMGGQCACQPNFYESANGVCQTCSSQCLTCSGSPQNCTSCDPNFNRVLVNNDCPCLPGFLSSGLQQCVISNCTYDPFCAVCVNSSPTQTVCVRCVESLNRVLNPVLGNCVCMNGFFNKNGVCFSCGSGCQRCSSLTNCTLCAALAIPQSNGSCLCPPSTFIAATPEGLKYCQNCNHLCKICNSSASCQVCQPNSNLVNGMCHCSQGFYQNKTTGECQACSVGCAICSDVGCTACVPPLLLSGSLCQSTCNFGFHSERGICVPCTRNCLTCRDNNNCGVCSLSFSLLNGRCVDECPNGTVSSQDSSNNSICVNCLAPCQTCTNNPSYCTSCRSSSMYLYFSGDYSTGIQNCVQACPLGTLAQDKTCTPCDSSCLSCDGSPTNCIQCYPSSMLYKGACVSTCPGIVSNSSFGSLCLDSCPDGTYNRTPKTCSPCNSQCATCSATPNNCTSCVVGVLADWGVCVTSCRSNQYLSGGICFNCSSKCVKCFRSADYCVQCPPNMVLSSGTCVHSCQSGQYYNNSLQVCLDCQNTCGTCINSTYCHTCKNGLYTPRNGFCPSCPAPCQLCGADDRCLQCSATTSLFNGACVASCPNSTILQNGNCVCAVGVLNGDQCISSCPLGSFTRSQICYICDPNCLECLGESTNCTNCFTGFSLTGSNCVSSSGCSYGQIMNNGMCQHICMNGSFFYENSCLYRQCPEGFQDNFMGGCQRKWLYECPEGQYYLAGNCVPSCGVGYFVNYHNRRCLACPSHCDSCSSQSECFVCSPNYTNIEGYCYLNSCPCGKVSLGDKCVENCPPGTKQQGLACVPRCGTNKYLYNEVCYSTCPNKVNNGYACIAQQSPCNQSY